jgi:hypothetical protein
MKPWLRPMRTCSAEATATQFLLMPPPERTRAAMAIGIGRDEGRTEIHLHRLLENVQPALLPVGEGRLDRGGIFDRERDFASACLRMARAPRSCATTAQHHAFP